MGYTEWKIVNFDYSRLKLGSPPNLLQPPALSNESRLGKPSIENPRYYLEIFQIALPLPSSPIFLEKRVLNFSIFAEETLPKNMDLHF